MFNLIPWKKTNGGGVKVRRDEEFFPVARLRDEFDALWDRFMTDWQRGLSTLEEDFRSGLSGSVEDLPHEYMFRAQLPGFDSKDIDVQVSGNTLSIKAEHKQEEKAEQGASSRYGSFHEFFTLPSGVDTSRIEARYHSGVLEVHLPKTEEAKAKRIAVTSA